jgi:NAD-dependent dihydropyrimidine dehydrogenase PreA subunit
VEYLLGGHSLAVDGDACTGCGRCEEVCPHGVFTILDRKAVIINRRHCMECGACRINCPSEAISVSSGVGCAVAVIRSRGSKDSPHAPAASVKSTIK